MRVGDPHARFPPGRVLGICSVNRSLVIGAATAVAGGLVFCIPVAGQNPPPAPKAQHVEIIKGPALETSHDDIAIVRWTITNPGGDDDHYSVIHYGTDPNNLSQTAKNHIRLNQSHRETVFRVRMAGLKPDTTYYYKVTWMGYDGVSDGVESPVRQFTTAAPGQQTSAHPFPE
jgi:phosphodiesterase/alkaline phosphatase D-like protein